MLGEIGEAAARLRFLKLGFQFDVRSRLEAGIDAIVEVMDKGKPLAKMIAVQVKARYSNDYASEDDDGFYYTLRSEDLEYWRPSNLPVIIVLYRDSDATFFWKEVPRDIGGERRLRFDKRLDVLDEQAVDRLAAITVPKAGFGYYIPPLGGGEDALVNMLPIMLPTEMYVAPTTRTPKEAIKALLELDEPARFDWVMKGDTFWSFQDPRNNVCDEIVEHDMVEAIDTRYLAFHEDIDERNAFAHLLRRTLSHQFQKDLGWDKDRGQFYFKALAANTSRTFSYKSSKVKASSDVVNVAKQKSNPERIAFVRHHAFIPRFEKLLDEWFLVVNPNYHFTTNGFQPHSYPAELLAGKKRLDNSASLRGQVILWHRFLTLGDEDARSLFVEAVEEARLRFGTPPEVHLEMRVPEDVWGSRKVKDDDAESKQAEIQFK
ncbi:DUF4365 domain-containing protein [Mesorhizobium delmotii]|uniref:DUF4365 domain-containing protein n=1 Tax=Mesorhizobium delmotii TaxID=1631247 RepID=UPI001FCE54E5|nr:DUF4365 domain-containing protein [Mesorhizobium delmotii]